MVRASSIRLMKQTGPGFRALAVGLCLLALSACAAAEGATSAVSTAGSAILKPVTTAATAVWEPATKAAVAVWEPTTTVAMAVWEPAKAIGSKVAPYVNSASPWARDAGLLIASETLEQPSPFYGKAWAGCRSFLTTDRARYQRCRDRATGPRSHHW